MNADARDLETVARRMALMDSREGPRVGDFVAFPSGLVRRVSHHWRDEDGWDGGVQTSDGGSFYLGDWGCSFSGSLHPAVPTESLVPTGELRSGGVWVFHDDVAGAGRGVHADAQFRVFRCELPAP